tara:strand:+ start:7606 stop:7827 length:222 start_codon:yes stop_codon:yes gene_type:complete
MHRVQGHSDLARDPKTNAIINTNTLEYDKYVSRRNVSVENNERVDEIEQNLSDLKGEINEIKSLLKELVTNVK